MMLVLGTIAIKDLDGSIVSSNGDRESDDTIASLNNVEVVLWN